VLGVNGFKGVVRDEVEPRLAEAVLPAELTRDDVSKERSFSSVLVVLRRWRGSGVGAIATTGGTRLLAVVDFPVAVTFAFAIFRAAVVVEEE